MITKLAGLVIIVLALIVGMEDYPYLWAFIFTFGLYLFLGWLKDK